MARNDGGEAFPGRRFDDTRPAGNRRGARIIRLRGIAMSKQEMREETDRLIREALERKNLKVSRLETKIATKCGKCGHQGHVMAAPGTERVTFKCSACSHQQMVL